MLACKSTEHMLKSVTLYPDTIKDSTIIIVNRTHSFMLTQSPEAKLMCVVECCRLLIRLLQLAKCGDPPGADDTFPALIYIVIKANPPSLLSTVQYIQTYCDTTIAGEEAYWWTQFMIAVECTKTPGFTQ